ncbi:MAG TPA: uroporphyrinogen-III C-methyltransferase [Candidatus Methylomirabilis sp.]|nr:uroporphyrinogen-III C-methyltransferase [Candidatus Methylomirabilis sp.]
MVEGQVVLVGAGPGDPELITVRGLRWLRRADVVVYDHLVAQRLLDEAPEHALRIFAGKSAGRHCIEQSAINAILVHHAYRGRLVVRLKGGDPFVFGRGGEEALACAAAGIPVEVVPGVSSVVSVPARAGIPITHRGLGSSFAVVTGHEDPAKSETAVNWERVATSVDTLVIVMGLAAIPGIARRLIAAGRDAATPVVVISRGTTPSQEIVTGILADIAARVRHLAAPAIIVVGNVVGLADRLSDALGNLEARKGALDDRATVHVDL